MGAWKTCYSSDLVTCLFGRWRVGVLLHHSERGLGGSSERPFYYYVLTLVICLENKLLYFMGLISFNTWEFPCSGLIWLCIFRHYDLTLPLPTPDICRNTLRDFVTCGCICLAATRQEPLVVTVLSGVKYDIFPFKYSNAIPITLGF